MAIADREKHVRNYTTAIQIHYYKPWLADENGISTRLWSSGDYNLTVFLMFMLEQQVHFLIVN